MTHPTDTTDRDRRALRDAFLAEMWPVVRELPRWQRELAHADPVVVHAPSTEVA